MSSNTRSSRFSHVSVASSPFVDDPNDQQSHKGLEDDYGTPTTTKRRQVRPFNDEQVSELNEQIYSLQYELRTQQQEREMQKLNYEAQIRDLEKRVLEEAKRADTSESNQIFLFKKNKELTEQLTKERQEAASTKQTLESTISKLHAQTEKTYEELALTKDQLDDSEVRSSTRINGLSTQLQQVSFARDQFELERNELAEQLATKNSENIDLESKLVHLQREVQKLKSDAGDATDLMAVRRDLSDQLATISRLQDLTDKQQHELESLREIKQYVGILEEEKHMLAAQAAHIPKYKDQIASLQEQLFNLEQESTSWKAYLDKDDQNLSPESIARSLMQLKLERVTLTERLGRLEAELGANQDTSYLEAQDVEHTRAVITDLENKLTKESDQRARLENQLRLASDEIELLRSQVHSYESEERSDKNEASATAQRLSQLEKSLTQYREEAARLADELAKKDSIVNTLNSPLKRTARDSDSFSSDRLSEALRKNRNLQAEVDSLNSSIALLKKDHQVLETKLANMRRASDIGTKGLDGSPYRILQLRDNPTSKHEAIKATTLQMLKQENNTLIAQLENRPIPSGKDRLLPQSTVERMRLETQEMERTVKEQTKRTERLKEVFGKKSLEFREAVYALLGYQIDLLPNKKIRAKSSFSNQVFTFLPDPKVKNKLSGVEDGDYDPEVQNLITFWIKERGDIPCFLAALNLELYDKSTKAARF